jgi:aminoglycoside phosphotransferase (APT) family kinase protein
VPLRERTTLVREHLDRLRGSIDQRAVLDLWKAVLEAPRFPGAPTWIHGDLHPGNLIVEDGRLSGVIDFGDLTAGDPATDLAVTWMMFPPALRPAFVTAAGYEGDGALLTRARGWALALGLAFAANSADDPRMTALGYATLTAALER